MKLLKLYKLLIATHLLSAASFGHSDGLSEGEVKTTADIGCVDAHSFEKSGPNFLPEEGFVPNEQVAGEVAIAILAPIYGRKNILGQRPFRANLDNGTWKVKGALKHGLKGGVAEIDLCKQNGRVLRVIHGK